jgi:hypothetical protein
MTESLLDSGNDRDDSRQTFVAAVLLGIAATLTALSSFMAALSDGESLQAFTTSNAALVEGNRYNDLGSQTRTADQQFFIEYLGSAWDGGDEFTIFLKRQLRPELREAIRWWENDVDAITPFDADPENPYVVAEFDRAEEQETLADDQFEEGADADERGDTFDLSTVLLALTLFFAGIATLFRRRSAQVAMLGMAVVTLLGGCVVLGYAFVAQ